MAAFFIPKTPQKMKGPEWISGKGGTHGIFHISSKYASNARCRARRRFGGMGRYQSFGGLRLR